MLWTVTMAGCHPRYCWTEARGMRGYLAARQWGLARLGAAASVKASTKAERFRFWLQERSLPVSASPLARSRVQTAADVSRVDLAAGCV